MKNVLLILLVVLSFSTSAQNHENDTLLSAQTTEFVPENDTLFCNHLDEVNQLIYKNQFEDCENILKDDTLYWRTDSLPFTGVIKLMEKLSVGKIRRLYTIWIIENGIPTEQTQEVYSVLNSWDDYLIDSLKATEIQLYRSLQSKNWGEVEYSYAQYGSLIGVKTITTDGGFSIENAITFYIVGDTLSKLTSYVIDGVLVQEEKMYGLNHQLKSDSKRKTYNDSLKESTIQIYNENGEVSQWFYSFTSTNEIITESLTVNDLEDTLEYLYDRTDSIGSNHIEKFWNYATQEKLMIEKRTDGKFIRETSKVYNWGNKNTTLIISTSDYKDHWGYTAWINEVNDTIQKYPFLNDQWHGISIDRIDYGGYNYVTLQMKWNKGVLVDVINENVVFIKGYKKKMLEENYIEIINNQINGPMVYPVLVPYELHKGIKEDIILFTEKSFYRTSSEIEFYERIQYILKRVKKS